MEQTLEMVRTVKADVLVLDTSMPDHTGFDVLAEVRNLESGPLVVVLAPHTEASYAARVIAAGAHAYLDRTAEPQALIDAIHAVSRGEQVVPPGVEALLAAGDGHPASALTARELQVMEMLARGMTNREIAEHLGISIKTIDTAPRPRAREAGVAQRLRAHAVRGQGRLRHAEARAAGGGRVTGGAPAAPRARPAARRPSRAW